MKKILLGLCLMFALALNVDAALITTESELDTCISTTGNTCTLGNDLNVNGQKIIEEGNEIVLDLNGYTLSYGNTTAIGSGLLLVRNGAKLTINDSGSTGKILSSDYVYGAVAVTRSGDDATQTAELVVNGGQLTGYWYAIVGNGQRHNTKITVNNGKLTCVADGCLGIYHPQYGELIVNNGEITGATGIEMRAGKLTVNGGIITGNYSTTDYQPSNNGSTSVGAGIALMQHNTGLETKVTVNGGTVKGYTAVAQKNIQSLTADKLALIGITINGGKFETINGGTNILDVDDLTEFVVAGTFNKDFDVNYVHTDSMEESKSATEHIVYIIKSSETDIDEGTVLFETETSLNKLYYLDVVPKTAEEKNTAETKVKTTLASDKTKTDVKLIALYEIDIKNDLDAVVPMEDGNFKISIPLASDMKGYTTYKVVYINDQGEIEETLNASLVDGKVVFNTTHLSTYGIIGYNETNPKTGDGDEVVYILIGLLSGLGICSSLILAIKKRMI